MSRKGALVPPDGEERVRWYAEMQQLLFANPPEPEITDDEEESNEDLTMDSKSVSRGSSSRTKTASSTNPETPSFQSFVSSLAHETAALKDQHSFISSSTKLSSEKPLRHFPREVLERSLIRLNNPRTIRATLVCLLGFNDNGLCLSKYGDNLANYDIEMISFIFPGRLDRTHEESYDSVQDFAEFVICCLTHHKYLRPAMDSTAASLSLTSSSVISTDSHSLSSDHLILNRDGNQPSLSLFGHNLGGIIAFEVAREIERATRVTLPAPPLHALLVSGCRPPLALTQFNKDEKSRKFSRDSNKLLLDRMIELGCVPSYLLSRRDMLQPYLSRFRSGPLLSLVLPILTSLSAVSLLYGSEYLAMETYRYLRQLGTTQGSAPLKCEIVAMCGGKDKTVSERLLMQWGDMTTGSFQHHIFDHGDHYYWLPRHTQGQLQGGEGESVGGGRSSASVESALRSHEIDFLRLLIRSSNPFHILLSEDEARVGEGDEEEGDDQKSAVSSVTFQDSYRSSLPTARSARQGQEAAEEKMNSSRPCSRGRGRRSEDK